MTFAFKLHRAALTEAARRAVTVTGMVTVAAQSPGPDSSWRQSCHGALHMSDSKQQAGLGF